VASDGWQIKHDDQRQGIALIIVLGMLAVMMVLGVAFVTAMRTERVAAGNFMEVMKARHLVYTALARAMDDIEEDMAYNSTPLYPEWYTNYPYAFATKSVDLHTGDAQQLVPLRLLRTSRKLASPGKVTTATGSSLYDEHAEWDDNPAPGLDIERIPASGAGRQYGTVNAIAGNTLDTSLGWTDNDLYRVSLPQWQEVEGEGRIAYLVVDASGLLDGSYVGGSPSRGRGASPRDIRFGTPGGGIPLPDAGSSFASERDSYTNSTGYAYENMSEMIDENPAMASVTEIGNVSAFSRFPGTVHDEATGSEYDLVDIVGKADSDLQTDSVNIQQALARAFAAGAAPADLPDPGSWGLAAQQVFGNLLDYVDADSDPQSLDGPYVELGPLINEVWIQGNFTVEPDGNTVNGGTMMVWVECAYPFVEGINPSPFVLQDTTTFLGVPSEIIFAPLTDLVPAPLTYNANPSIMYEALPVAVFSFSSTNIAGAVFTVSLDMEVQGPDGVVDRVNGLTLTYTSVGMPPGPGAKYFAAAGTQVIDPVYNWDPNTHWRSSLFSGSYWDPYTNTPAARNDITAKYMALARDNSDVDGTSPYLHVANEPIQTIGELGYLVSPGLFGDTTYAAMAFSDPPLLMVSGSQQWLATRLWRTVWLYDHEDITVTSEGNARTYDTSWARMLDYFGQYGVPVDMTATHGAVNPNTPLRGVLGSVFMNMQIDQYFDAPVTTNGTWSGTPGALQMADAIQTQVADPAFGPIDRLSELGRPDMANAVLAVMQNLKGSALTEMEKESFYRNAAGLLNPRQNVFCILLSGKSKIAVEQRALAVVWRDPIADSNGLHPSYIRWFTWLEE